MIIIGNKLLIFQNKTPPCSEKDLRKVQGLLRSRMPALQNSSMKSRYVEEHEKN
jgi:hypothetical protein